MNLLEVRDLTMHYRTKKGDVSAVDRVSLTLKQGEALGLVGESGCGKSSLAITLLRLLPENAQIRGGHVFYRCKDLLKLPEEEARWYERAGVIKEDHVDLLKLPERHMRKVRWKGISMVFQAAMNSLNPVYRVSEQIVEAMQTHNGVGTPEARKRVAELFELVGLNPNRMDQYPHEYSGGMRQRAVIAMALACDPSLIIADEPTTALDVIVQDRILNKLDEIRHQLNMSVIYISHDIAVIAEVSDKVGIMYAGKLVEMGPTEVIFKRPRHPYTAALMSAFPSIRGEKHELTIVPGEPPNLLQPPSGCRFHPRCPHATAICQEQVPQLQPFGEEHYAACWNPVQR